MANRPLNEKELLEIIENDEFWEDREDEEGCSSNNGNVLHATAAQATTR